MSQAEIKFVKNFVVKRYLDKPKNALSSVEHELKVIERFDSRHAPKIYAFTREGYYMRRYDYVLGTVKKLDWLCPDMVKELDSLETDLKNCGIRHRDINPGNLLWSEADMSLKLIDFYWALLPGEEPYEVPKLNKHYGDDKEAFEKIRRECGKGHKTLGGNTGR